MKRSVLPGGLARWLCAVCLILLSGCESDPVLSPQPDEEEEGSYGRSVITPRGADDQGAREPNPTVF